MKKLAGCDARYAFYFNPHVVFTRMVRFPAAEQQSVEQTIGTWASSASDSFRVGQNSDVSPELQLGGVPSGRSDHDEIYFEVKSSTIECSLHQSGQSFRVRMTTQGDGRDAYAGRVLIVRTQYPVPYDRLTGLSPGTYWNHLEVERYPSFSELRSIFPSLALSTALPCVVDCFVVYLSSASLPGISLDELVRGQLGPAFPIARFRKTSTKFELRDWSQDGRSGQMDPRWAYLTLDHVQARSGYPGPSTVPWHDLRQIELEVGPSPQMASVALESITTLDQRLARVVEELRPAYGRKIHRLLCERGVKLGGGDTNRYGL